MSQWPENVELVWSLIEGIKTPMVVTHTAGHGELRARPMAAHPDRENNAIHFLTDAESTKDEEIDRDNHVCLVFADIQKQKFVSVTGIAELSDNRGLISRLWSSEDSAFWRDGTNPSIRLLTITPSSAEYWDSADAATSYVKMVKAFLTGSPPEPRVNKTVSLP